MINGACYLFLETRNGLTFFCAEFWTWKDRSEKPDQSKKNVVASF